MHQVVVAAALAFARDKPGALQVGHNPLDCAFTDADLHREFTQANVLFQKDDRFTYIRQMLTSVTSPAPAP